MDYDEPGALLSRSFKDEILGGSGGLGAWQEKQTREMLQDHIQTVTLAIKKLSAEIEVCLGILKN